jgi:hypothetical protein
MVSNLTVKVGADVDGLRKELNKASGHLQSFNSGMAKLGGVMAGAFAVDKIIDFGKEIFNTTAKFQKFEAVLTNTLGDNSAAQAAMAQITEFAAKTPYGVDELTASFVKLANQGFIPTITEMRKLGDLASSQGKTFDQLTEAIIDAQTGEFERLKEFGIRASKEGDKVSFTFKGVKEQVDFTSQSIRDYILSLGDVQGVTGGMEAQSKTLGGGLSNLEDAFEQLKLKMGEAAESGGLFSLTLDGIAAGVKGVTKLFEGNTIQQSVDALQELRKLRQQAAVDKDIDLWIKYNEIINSGTAEVQKYYDAHIKGQEKLNEARNKANQMQVTEKKPPSDSGPFKINPIQNEELKPQFTTPEEVEGIQNTVTHAKNLKFEITAARGELQLFGAEWVAAWASMGQAALDVGPIINETFANMAIGFGEALGDMASGLGGTELIWASVLGAIGTMCTQLGQLAIGTGITVLGIKKALESLNPYAAIAGGIALIALGKIVSNKAKSIASSGGSGGSSSGTISSPDINKNNKFKQEIILGGEFKIKGGDLEMALSNQNIKSRRTG